MSYSYNDLKSLQAEQQKWVKKAEDYHKLAEAAKEAGCKTTQATEAERKGLYTMRNGWCKRRLKEFAQDIITSRAMYHSGFTVWKNKGMSAPEYAVLRMEELEIQSFLTR